MKELKLETRVEVYAVGELDNIYRQLYEAAFEASKKLMLLIPSFMWERRFYWRMGRYFPEIIRKTQPIRLGFVRSGPPYFMREHVIRMRQFRFCDRGYEGWGTCGSYHALWCLPASDVGNRATL